MPQQPNLFSTEPPADSSGEPADTPGPRLQPLPARSGSRRWLSLAWLVVRVTVRLCLGLLVMVLPWSHPWDDNHFFAYYPQLGIIASMGAVRGIVSGLGLLNIWIAISDAIHYRDSGF